MCLFLGSVLLLATLSPTPPFSLAFSLLLSPVVVPHPLPPNLFKCSSCSHLASPTLLLSGNCFSLVMVVPERPLSSSAIKLENSKSNTYVSSMNKSSLSHHSRLLPWVLRYTPSTSTQTMVRFASKCGILPAKRSSAACVRDTSTPTFPPPSSMLSSDLPVLTS